MNFREAIAGAESHYDRDEFLPSLALGILALGLALKEAQEDEDQPDWKRALKQPVSDGSYKCSCGWDTTDSRAAYMHSFGYNHWVRDLEKERYVTNAPPIN